MGNRYPAATNIGFRPTVNSEEVAASLSIETHVLDFDQNVYRKEANLEFLMRLRDERRFSGKAALVVGAGIGVPSWKQMLERLTKALETRGRQGDDAATKDLEKLLRQGSTGVFLASFSHRGSRQKRL